MSSFDESAVHSNAESDTRLVLAVKLRLYSTPLAPTKPTRCPQKIHAAHNRHSPHVETQGRNKDPGNRKPTHYEALICQIIMPACGSRNPKILPNHVDQNKKASKPEQTAPRPQNHEKKRKSSPLKNHQNPATKNTKSAKIKKKTTLVTSSRHFPCC